MVKILFVCHGSICRSPMAEFIMKDLVAKAGLAAQFSIDSAATSREEIGNPIYPLAQEMLSAHGITGAIHHARQMMKEDYQNYDFLIGMDQQNLKNMQKICAGDPSAKISLLLDYTAHSGNIADPWYTGDFETAWQDIYAGCAGLLEKLTQTKNEH